jgi:condensin complex subunit 3
VEEAFLPTLRTLLNAPATSPLAEVDVNNVAELLVQLTNTKLLTANQNNTEISLVGAFQFFFN